MNINAFKVVDRETRHGTNWAIHYAHLRRSLEVTKTPLMRKMALRTVEATEIFVKDNQELFPIYEKDAIIEMASNTVGLMTFGTYKDAHTFMDLHTFDVIILSIEIIGDLLPTNAEILIGCGSDIRSLKDIFSVEVERTPAPKGTLFCEKLKVLN